MIEVWCHCARAIETWYSWKDKVLSLIVQNLIHGLAEKGARGWGKFCPPFSQ